MLINRTRHLFNVQCMSKLSQRGFLFRKTETEEQKEAPKNEVPKNEAPNDPVNRSVDRG